MENSSQAKTIELLAAAVISLACRLEGYPRTLQEISQATRLDVVIISRVQIILARDLQIVTGLVAPQDLIARIVCNPLVRMTDPVVIQFAKVLSIKSMQLLHYRKHRHFLLSFHFFTSIICLFRIITYANCDFLFSMFIYVFSSFCSFQNINISIFICYAGYM